MSRYSVPLVIFIFAGAQLPEPRRRPRPLSLQRPASAPTLSARLPTTPGAREAVAASVATGAHLQRNKTPEATTTAAPTSYSRPMPVMKAPLAGGGVASNNNSRKKIRSRRRLHRSNVKIPVFCVTRIRFNIDSVIWRECAVNKAIVVPLENSRGMVGEGCCWLVVWSVGELRCWECGARRRWIDQSRRWLIGESHKQEARRVRKKEDGPSQRNGTKKRKAKCREFF